MFGSATMVHSWCGDEMLGLFIVETLQSRLSTSSYEMDFVEIWIQIDALFCPIKFGMRPFRETALPLSCAFFSTRGHLTKFSLSVLVCDRVWWRELAKSFTKLFWLTSFLQFDFGFFGEFELFFSVCVYQLFLTQNPFAGFPVSLSKLNNFPFKRPFARQLMSLQSVSLGAPKKTNFAADSRVCFVWFTWILIRDLV